MGVSRRRPLTPPVSLSSWRSLCQGGQAVCASWRPVAKQMDAVHVGLLRRLVHELVEVVLREVQDRVAAAEMPAALVAGKDGFRRPEPPVHLDPRHAA